MTLIFAGTPPFAAAALEALLKAGFEIGLVLTQPDRPAGRGLRTHESAVKLRAQAHGLALAQPASLKDPGIQATLRAIGAQAMVVAAYGLILPPAVLNIPARGCLNIHASLLPRWRGAAPIQRALLAGDTETGITIMQMDESLDTGPMLLQQRVAIAGDDTGADAARQARAGRRRGYRAGLAHAVHGAGAGFRARHVRRKNYQGGCRDRLGARCRRYLPPGAGLQSDARRGDDVERIGAQDMARDGRGERRRIPGHRRQGRQRWNRRRCRFSGGQNYRTAKSRRQAPTRRVVSRRRGARCRVAAGDLKLRLSCLCY